MAYDPADLRLPRSLLTLLDFLVRIRLPVWPGWHLNLTRPGALYLASILGVWAAGLYSGNNLLYLCGSMLLALASTGLIVSARLLNCVPQLAVYMPEFSESGTAGALHQRLACSFPFAACVDVTWQGTHTATATVRCSPDGSALLARLAAMPRGIYDFSKQWLSTEAPLGMWRLEHTRQEAWQWAVLPRSLAWSGTGLESRRGGEAHREGDEWRDLRAYVRGDPLSRIHWRKSFQGDWSVKQFSDESAIAQQQFLRVDLRGPSGDAFERLLGRAHFWMTSFPEGTLALGSHMFELNDEDQLKRAMLSLAAAVPETAPPAGQGGVLLSIRKLSVGEDRCAA